jgi:hypothetical protein
MLKTKVRDKTVFSIKYAFNAFITVIGKMARILIALGKAMEAALKCTGATAGTDEDLEQDGPGPSTRKRARKRNGLGFNEKTVMRDSLSSRCYESK